MARELSGRVRNTPHSTKHEQSEPENRIFPFRFISLRKSLLEKSHIWRQNMQAVAVLQGSLKSR